jgi:hypothetical protein
MQTLFQKCFKTYKQIKFLLYKEYAFKLTIKGGEN